MKKVTEKPGKTEFGSSSQITYKENKVADFIIFAVLVLLYVLVTVSTSVIANSDKVFMIKGYPLQLKACTGVFSSLGNIIIIFIAVFYGRLGFIVSVCLILLQAPMIVTGMLSSRSLQSLPGLFINLLTLVAVVLIFTRNWTINKYRNKEIEHLVGQQKFSQRLFEQTATALVNAIDKKDEYSHGHSLRVAQYAERIARMMGKTDEECYRVYYAGLLHDVGKIGIDDNIINKKGKLSTDEYDVIKKHPFMGNQILQSISEYPYLSIGAHYHHERYDGKGYPDGLKGEDIPEIARIISVADAYDAMTSNRSYRDTIPQQLVREEIVKNAGTQFDPEIAKVMKQLIDIDGEYKMREMLEVKELAGKNELKVGEFRSEVSDGILITPWLTRIHMKSVSTVDENDSGNAPALILFDSLDARYHDDEKTISDLNYYEYAEIRFDGRINSEGSRKAEIKIYNFDEEAAAKPFPKEAEYDIEAVKFRDHVQIKIKNEIRELTVTLALPDSSRFAYIGLTGEDCLISDVRIEKEEEPVGSGYITRIADEISYIDRPAGDIPNVQVDGIRSDATLGVPISERFEMSFHAMSLPTARLIWHCPYIVIFTSEDGKVNGKDYRELVLVRLDGETPDSDDHNKLTVNKTDDFLGWDQWKQFNKTGFDCRISFKKAIGKLTLETENCGINIKDTLILPEDPGDVYVSITGDQVAISDIHILRRGSV